MGKSQRDKGKRGERRAVKLLQPVYPKAYRSANQSGSDKQPDVDGTPWWCEAKEAKTHSVWAAVRQAVAARDKAGDDRPVLVLSKRTRGMYLAVMDGYGMPVSLWPEGQSFPLFEVLAARWEAIAAVGPAVVVNKKTGFQVIVMRAEPFVELLDVRR